MSAIFRTTVKKQETYLHQWTILYYNSTHCPNMVKNLSMYVGPHDVYPTMDVNFSILTRECKNKKLVDNIFFSNFVSLSMC